MQIGWEVFAFAPAQDGDLARDYRAGPVLDGPLLPYPQRWSCRELGQAAGPP